MTADLLIFKCRGLGVTLAPGPEGKLRVSPPGVVPEDLREALRQHKGEILALLNQSARPTLYPVWPCEHCGQPAEIEAVGPSLDGQRTLTFWNCQPCQTWGVTPDTLREPPVWVSKREQ